MRLISFSMMEKFVIAFVGLLLTAVNGEDNKHVALNLGEEAGPYTTECNQYSYFTVRAEHPCDDLNIMINQKEGEPNVYVSKDPYRYPTYRSLAWASYNWGSENLTISSWDVNFRPGVYYIGVHAYCGNDVTTGHKSAKYTVKAQQVTHTHPSTDDIFGKYESNVVEARDYKYHRFCMPNTCNKVEVVLENCINPTQCPSSYAYPELIVSATEEKPTVNSMAWMLAEVDHRSITLDPEDEMVKPGHYYIAVYGWCTPDDLCPNKTVCGPCSYASSVSYNVSVKTQDICSSDVGKTSFHMLSLTFAVLMSASVALQNLV